jgi:hypothetical protein
MGLGAAATAFVAASPDGLDPNPNVEYPIRQWMIEIGRNPAWFDLDQAERPPIAAGDALDSLEDRPRIEAPRTRLDETAPREAAIELLRPQGQPEVVAHRRQQGSGLEAVRGNMANRPIHHLGLKLGRKQVTPEVEPSRDSRVRMSSILALPSQIESDPDQRLSTRTLQLVLVWRQRHRITLTKSTKP